MTALLLATLIAVQAQGQIPPQAPPVEIPAQAPQIEELMKPALTYAEASAQALKEGRPLILFVKCEPRPIGGAVVVCADNLPEYQRAQIVVAVPDGKRAMTWQASLRYDATEAQIRVEAGLEVSRTAPPFSQPSEQFMPPTADDNGPWLSSSETAKIKKACHNGIPFGRNLRSFSLARRAPR